MARDEIPQAVARFLQDEVESAREVEALLLLREAPNRAWTPEGLAREMRSSPGWAAQQLEGLRDKGLVETAPDTSGAPGYRYHPARDEQESMVASLAELYARRKNTVIALIFGQAERDPVRSFSDAFRIRRDR